SIDLLKSKKQIMQDLDEVHLKVVDISYEGEWLMDDAITLEDVKQAISNLPEKYKYVVMLFLIEGYDHQEISQILSISEVASRTQLSRGKVKLRDVLNHKRNGTRY
ncbi:MAG: RNA polymerase sigma factor, partial [Flavobacteriaceae bacterium]|nr:RNA polymerase sigma factor [Flavobacteriaceae bacterium]